jgi:hypothetical protein
MDGHGAARPIPTGYPVFEGHLRHPYRKRFPISFA